MRQNRCNDQKTACGADPKRRRREPGFQVASSTGNRHRCFVEIPRRYGPRGCQLTWAPLQPISAGGVGDTCIRHVNQGFKIEIQIFSKNKNLNRLVVPTRCDEIREEHVSYGSVLPAEQGFSWRRCKESLLVTRRLPASPC
jgi:hypothetical protein